MHPRWGRVDMTEGPPNVPHDWRRRRLVIWCTLSFCAGGVAFALLRPGDAVSAPVRGSIAQGLILLAGGVVGSYVFGATWDDKNRLQVRQ